MPKDSGFNDSTADNDARVVHVDFTARTSAEVTVDLFDDVQDGSLSEDCRSRVIVFPIKTATTVDEGSKTAQEQSCTTSTASDAAPRSSARSSSTGSSSPLPSRGGSGSLGVLMPSLPLRSPVSGTGASDVGVLTHALVAAHVGLRVNNQYPENLIERLFAFSEALVNANPNRRRVIATEASGLAFRYLTRLAPVDPWNVLGVEYDTEGGGRVDVAWFHTVDGSVMFDELKTSRVATVMPKGWVAQARRYSVAGAATFGDHFVGTRLVPIDVMRLARLVPSVGLPVPISPRRGNPTRPTAGGLS
ncbi:hypothetical protein KRR39_20350 [Nocardioides panacis]|uniref:Uncharacterized protein n=1 Tax=Nocardioides panacis TaxID=2849501 RepID=A0A975XZR7_9ACTN|nr:hypothetical protein [Nocardioides panacis]QWZ07716.1 hypothetical protein KRR39_20350 [Nocardioides panacis]